MHNTKDYTKEELELIDECCAYPFSKIESKTKQAQIKNLIQNNIGKPDDYYAVTLRKHLSNHINRTNTLAVFVALTSLVICGINWLNGTLAEPKVYPVIIIYLLLAVELVLVTILIVGTNHSKRKTGEISRQMGAHSRLINYAKMKEVMHHDQV